MLEAILWSKRSHDVETQCGCVLVKNNTVISTGYNGFIRDIDDSALPNIRPYKYDFMIHAEHNAILNCVRNGVSTNLATAYITGEPCNWCFQYLWQAGINRIVYTDYSQPKMVNNEQHKNIKNALLELMNPEYESIYAGLCRKNRVHRISLEFISYEVLQEYWFDIKLILDPQVAGYFSKYEYDSPIWNKIIQVIRTENNE